MPFDGSTQPEPTVEQQMLASFEQAMDLLKDKKNWAKLSMYYTDRGTPRYCLVGAIATTLGVAPMEGRSPSSHDQLFDAAHAHQIYDLCLALMAKIIIIRTTRRYTSAEKPEAVVVGFNDHSDTTHAMVIALLRSARNDLLAVQNPSLWNTILRSVGIRKPILVTT